MRGPYRDLLLILKERHFLASKTKTVNLTIAQIRFGPQTVLADLIDGR